jgi:thiol-disulfide isomerase/thioredoxin
MRYQHTIIPALTLCLIAGAVSISTGPAADAAGNSPGNVMHAAPALDAEAPGFTFMDPDGQSHSLADYRGKVVVLDFWATWCGPCRKVMPEMQKMHEQYQDRGVVVIGMNGGERGGDPVGYMKKQGYTYKLLLKTEPAMQTYGVTGIPAFFVISADGKLAWKGSGAAPSTHKQLLQAVERELAKSNS